MVTPLSGAKRKRQLMKENKTLRRLGNLFDDPDRQDYEFVCAQLDPKRGGPREARQEGRGDDQEGYS